MSPVGEVEGERRGRGARALLLGLLAALALSGCGLESIAFIPSPIYSASSGSLYLQDQGAVSSALPATYLFLGYQILYRIYSDQDAATQAVSTINSQIGSGLSPDSVYAQLVGSDKLVPMSFTGVASRTILPATSGDPAYVSFVLSTAAAGDWSVTKSTGTFPPGVLAQRSYTGSAAGRSASLAEGSINLLGGDEDYAGTATPSPGSTLYLVTCAVGIASVDLVGSSYSAPTVLDSSSLSGAAGILNISY